MKINLRETLDFSKWRQVSPKFAWSLFTEFKWRVRLISPSNCQSNCVTRKQSSAMCFFQAFTCISSPHQGLYPRFILTRFRPLGLSWRPDAFSSVLRLQLQCFAGARSGRNSRHLQITSQCFDWDKFSLQKNSKRTTGAIRRSKSSFLFAFYSKTQFLCTK